MDSSIGYKPSIGCKQKKKTVKKEGCSYWWQNDICKQQS